MVIKNCPLSYLFKLYLSTFDLFFCANRRSYTILCPFIIDYSNKKKLYRTYPLEVINILKRKSCKIHYNPYNIVIKYKNLCFVIRNINNRLFLFTVLGRIINWRRKKMGIKGRKVRISYHLNVIFLLPRVKI